MRFLTILSVILCCFSSCKKDPIDKLPPATQEGLNTLGCIIEGKVFSTTHNPKISTDWNCYPKCEFLETGLSGQRIHGKPCDGNGNGFGNIYIYIYAELESGKTYSNDEIIGTIDGNNGHYQTSDSETLSLTITRLTPDIIAGTFSGTVIGITGSDSGNVITITDGRFDIKRK